MNLLPKKELPDEEEGGYLASVSDLMAGLVFVFIITLMVYVINFQLATQKVKQQQDVIKKERDRLANVIDDLTNTRRLRAEMLLRIQKELEAKGLRVEVDTEHGILHLTEDTLQFESGKAELPDDQKPRLEIVSKVLANVLPCYTAAPPADHKCNPRYAGKLESILIEGHTDNIPYTRGRFRDNWDLSAQRAMYTYRTMVMEMQPELSQLRNTEGFPIFGVAGYGEGRPREGHRHERPVSDPANRRIDIRFIMTPPSDNVPPARELKEKGL
ncbi:hypothetical protein D6779_07820 [Candidatus Parcubacteria bacterium]|nr:MAG: hypothetical protein D6779_07820 [Candidatus Parcubacteria bacterium]